MSSFVERALFGGSVSGVVFRQKHFFAAGGAQSSVVRKGAHISASRRMLLEGVERLREGPF